jgi:hypothetical protein
MKTGDNEDGPDDNMTCRVSRDAKIDHNELLTVRREKLISAGRRIVFSVVQWLSVAYPAISN